MYQGTNQPPIGTQLNRSHSLSQGMIGCWPLNEGGGQKAINYSQPNKNGTLSNGAVFKQTNFGNCANIDATNDYIEVGSGKYPLLKNNKWSGCAMIYVTSGNGRVMANWDTTVAGGWEFGVTVFAAQKLGVILTDANGVGYFGRDITGTISLNTWYFVSFSYDGSAAVTGIKLYVNGVLQPMTDRMNGSGDPGTLGDTDFMIGARKSGGAVVGSLSGTINSVYLWNRVVTETEMMQLYLNPYQMFKESGKFKMSIDLLRKFKFNNRGVRPRPFAPGHAR